MLKVTEIIQNNRKFNIINTYDKIIINLTNILTNELYQTFYTIENIKKYFNIDVTIDYFYDEIVNYLNNNNPTICKYQCMEENEILIMLYIKYNEFSKKLCLVLQNIKYNNTINTNTNINTNVDINKNKSMVQIYEQLKELNDKTEKFILSIDTKYGNLINKIENIKKKIDIFEDDYYL